VIVLLAVFFAIDLFLKLGIPERAVLLVLAAGALAWSFKRFTWPLLGVCETELDMALLVERHEQIDSDLVAAVQFEQPGATNWGSPQLEAAVIERVATTSGRIDVYRGWPRKHTIRRLALLLVSLAGAVIAAIVWPDHVSALLNRLALGTMHYPTRTRIEQVIINGHVVLGDGAAGLKPSDCDSPQGRQVEFLVKCSGRLPKDGAIELLAQSPEGGRTRLTLKPSSEHDPGRTTLLAGYLHRLNEDLDYTVLAGDAWTESASIRMIPQPVVELRIHAIPPAYARAAASTPQPSSRQLSILEGSALDVTVVCTNRKRLQSAWMTLHSAGVSRRCDLVASDAEGWTWSAPSDASLLRDFRQDVRYEVQVLDNDGLSLETPITGTIRIRPDRPPTGQAEVIHQFVLPAAEPVVSYRAGDDFGISHAALLVEVERGATIVVPKHRVEMAAPRQPISGDLLPLLGQHRLPLSPLNLVKGDRVKLTLEVTDYRGENGQGEWTGIAFQDEPLVLEVSDEAGVLAAIGQADARSEEQLNEIIQRELVVGEAR
jgi:hypothetical protein